MIKTYKSIKEIPQKSKVFIYGSGTAGRSLFVYLKKLREDINVLGFIDSFKNGKIEKLKVYKFNEFLDKFSKSDYDLILVASMYSDEIVKKLKKSGINNYMLIKNINPSYSLFLGREKIFDIFKGFFTSALSLILKNKKKFLIVGEYGGNFVGNSKYFYLYLKEKKGFKSYWLTNKEDHYNELKEKGIKVIKFGKIKTLFHILTSGYIVFDNRDWWREYPILNNVKSKKIQLWHGVGFKYIELSLLDKEFLNKLNKNELKLLKKRYPSYDLLITTSEFYAKKVFSPAFGMPIEKVLPLGYPRNDVFYHDIDGEEINTDEKVLKFSKEFKRKGGKIIVFAPTFRDLLMKIDFRSVFDYEKLDEFLKKENIVFIIKGHSLPGINYLLKNIENYKNIMLYENKKDVYPLLKITDLLITDYSSIYTDFLHTKKPILFYPFDYEEYKELHRQLQFDYNEMTPGPKAKNFDELLGWIKYFLVENKDGFCEERERILELAFKYKDGRSSERIFSKILKL